MHSSTTTAPYRVLIVSRERGLDSQYGLGKSIQKICSNIEKDTIIFKYVSLSDTEQYHRKWRGIFTLFCKPFGNAGDILKEALLQGMYAASVIRLDSSIHAVWFQDPYMIAGFQLGLIKQGKFKSPLPLFLSEHGLGSYTSAIQQDGVSVPRYIYKALIQIEQFLIKDVANVFFPSKAALEAAGQDFSLSHTPKNWLAIPHGHNNISDLSIPTIREAKSNNAKQAMVLAVGRLAPVKNYPILIGAIAELQSQGYPIQLIIAGAGDLAEFRVTNNTDRLHPPPILGHSEDVQTLYSECTIYVSCCENESFGLANLEAMSAGAACILPNKGAAAEIGALGAILITMNKTNLVSAIKELLDDQNQLIHWQTKAKEASSQHPTWIETSKQYQAALLRGLAKQSI
jgi:glycosyltransferase involved in cell wall biosynthesis